MGISFALRAGLQGRGEHRPGHSFSTGIRRQSTGVAARCVGAAGTNVRLSAWAASCVRRFPDPGPSFYLGLGNAQFLSAECRVCSKNSRLCWIPPFAFQDTEEKTTTWYWKKINAPFKYPQTLDGARSPLSYAGAHGPVPGTLTPASRPPPRPLWLLKLTSHLRPTCT